MNDPLSDKLLKRIAAEQDRRAPPASFSPLPDIPVARYKENEFLKLERDRLWTQTWLYAGHTDELPNSGAYKLWDLSGVPVVILQDQPGEYRAFYNSCRHRGGPLVRESRGQLHGSLLCPYHGWNYSLDGKLIGVRDRGNFPGLNLQCRSLLPLRCERLGNWIFVNQDTEARPLAEDLGPIGEYFKRLDIDGLRLVHQETFTVSCNLKILLEGFLEVYHLSSLHENTVHRFLDYRRTHMELWRNGHSCMLTANRRKEWQDPGAQGMRPIPGTTDLERHNNPSLHIFPNLITPVSSTGLPFNLIWPISDDTSLLEVVWFAPDWGNASRPAGWKRRISNYNRIIGEDVALVEQIQSAVHSEGFKDIPLSYQERRLYHWHEELDRRIGAEQIPPAMRVTPALEPWVTETWA